MVYVEHKLYLPEHKPQNPIDVVTQVCQWMRLVSLSMCSGHLMSSSQQKNCCLTYAYLFGVQTVGSLSSDIHGGWIREAWLKAYPLVHKSSEINTKYRECDKDSSKGEHGSSDHHVYSIIMIKELEISKICILYPPKLKPISLFKVDFDR